ncbi:hypothetical protein HKD37_U058081 [Glycine soja]
MVAGQDVAEQQSHPYLSQGGHVGAHDPHPVSRQQSGQNLAPVYIATGRWPPHRTHRIRFLLWPYSHSWPSSSTKGYPRSWPIASASNGIH